MASKAKVSMVADDALNIQELGGRRVEIGETFEVSPEKAKELEKLNLAHRLVELHPVTEVEKKE